MPVRSTTHWSMAAVGGHKWPVCPQIVLPLPPHGRPHCRGRNLHCIAPPWGVRFNIVYLITAGLIGILARLRASRCGIGWSLPPQKLACWPATNNNHPLPREGIGDAVHAYRHNKETFFACQARLCPGQPTSARITYAVGTSQLGIMPCPQAETGGVTAKSDQQQPRRRLCAVEAA